MDLRSSKIAILAVKSTCEQFGVEGAPYLANNSLCDPMRTIRRVFSSGSL